MELDVLLPIANRRAYEEQLSHYAAAATENNPLSLVLVDVDHFKSFNDNHGHEVGDSVLVEIAKVASCYYGQVTRLGMAVKNW